jgi:hypothetical protein
LAARKLCAGGTSPNGVKVVEAVNPDFLVQNQKTGVSQLLELARKGDQSLKNLVKNNLF